MSVVAVKRTVVLSIALLSLASLVGLLSARFSEASQTSPPPPIVVAEQNLDASHFIRVHEQGTVPVVGTVNVGNTPAVQNVSVTNTPLPVTGSVQVTGQGTVKVFETELFPFTASQVFHVDIHKYTKVRLSVLVNGSGTVDIVYGTDASIPIQSFSVDSGDSHSELLPDIPGTDLEIDVGDPDGEQVFIRVFGGN